jgi:prepilin-type processing-associated H-X9-DG protein
MPIQFTCPHCGAETNVADEYAGQSGPCAQCGKTVTIPPRGAAPGHQPPAQRSTTAIVLIIVAVLGGMFLICGGIMVALLLPATQAARSSARQMACMSNLRQLGLAMHNYLDVYDCFPPAYTTDENGQPLHSWRVLLLPYLEQDYLYRQIDFDQPWDSPENQILVNMQMPLYTCPSATPIDPSETSYVMIVGPGTISDGPTATRFAQIADGMSYTIMIVEVADSGIHWAEPRDLNFDEMSFQINDPAGNSISSAHPGGANVVFADGHVESLDEFTSPEQIKAMITISGGEIVDLDEY